MAIKTDFHLHSSFSGDSDTPMEEMVQKAISLGLTHICFTEHYDPDYVYAKEEEQGCFEINTDSYLYDLLRLKAKYSDDINIRFGIELGLQPHIKRELAIYYKAHEFDFIIGSTHICNRKDPYYPEFFEGRDEDEAHHEYFEAVLESVKKLPYFDVYGHLDYVVRYGPTKNDNYTYFKHKDVFDKILTSLLEQEKGLELNSNIANGVGVIGNSTQLKQIVSILLDNAIRHSEGQGEVWLTLTKEHGLAKLSVVNKGDEIPEEQREQIFERFYRVDTARNGEDKHYGLGLAIAKAITTSHKGQIKVLCYNGFVEFKVQIPAQ